MSSGFSEPGARQTPNINLRPNFAPYVTTTMHCCGPAGTDGQVDWVFNDAQPGGGAVQFPRLNDVVQFRTLEVQPIPATFSVGVDVIEPLEP